MYFAGAKADQLSPTGKTFPTNGFRPRGTWLCLAAFLSEDEEWGRVVSKATNWEAGCDSARW